MGILISAELSLWVCVRVARLCCQVMGVKGNEACQIYSLSSYVLFFLFWRKLVLFFSFQSTACSDKAEVRVQTSPISKPAIFFGVLNNLYQLASLTAWLFFVFILLFSSLKRGIESQRRIRCHIVWKKVLHSCFLDWLDNFYFFVDGPTNINRPFSRWRHLTTTTRIHFVFALLLKFVNPAED